MLVRTVVADAFATKCYLVADGPGSDCVVVDPGYGVAEKLPAALAEDELTPRAVLLTHGHLDHTYSVTEVCARYRIPLYLHPDDHWMLSDPLAGLGPDVSPLFEEFLAPGWRWREPAEVESLAGGDVLELAGLPVRVDHTPGHTAGSVMFNLPGDLRVPGYCLVGDTLYAGSIGRTDQPSGDRGDTLRSLRSMLAKPREVVLYTAHGEDSTLATERTDNPFVWEAARWSGLGTPPTTADTVRDYKARTRK
ncbi:MBL fold metallo-hydrolase [Actinophytocola sediminis]